jgi:primosomal protein N' (replication factor Y) (superfamily II helicase)
MHADLFASSSKTITYATVILPLALPKLYTYGVPADMSQYVKLGVRVEVQFGKNKLYSAVVCKVHHDAPKDYKPKPIVSVLDDFPVVTEKQFELWNWIAAYYCCTVGEVMNAALPSGLKLASETKVIISPVFDGNYSDLNDKEYIVAEALTIQTELTIGEIKKLLQQKTVYPLINSLLEKRVIYLEEELQEKYKVKKVICVKLNEPYHSNPQRLREAFEMISKGASRQMETLIAFLQLSQEKSEITRKELCLRADVSAAIVKKIEEKGIFVLYEREVSRVGMYDEALITSFPLAEQQKRAIQEINEGFKKKNAILLHGVTGSGKTRVFVELIQETIKTGGQVLYLLPEIALTAQIINRLQRIFGNDITVYHSKLGDAERVETWQNTLHGKSVVLGARSGIFLPFTNLKLIIVDEEHDSSFKQTEPNPRYNARDLALFLANLHGAKTILGTATPSIETYYNAVTGKYGLVEMNERFGGLEMPQIIVADVKTETLQKKIQGNFTTTLIDQLKEALGRGEQAILFQNRRGYAPRLVCETCDWTAECTQCDVSLTFHKHSQELNCHLCGYHTKQPTSCPACGDKKLVIKGFGTERIEDDLQIYLPEAKIARMDLDTVRHKNGHIHIIQKFEKGEIDILVGTQMVTKGLDFDNVGIVGVFSADHLLYFPDFRATERAFQLMTQVSGRAGRKKKQGKVIVQAFNVAHPVLSEVIDNDYKRFFERELIERKEFFYPPFFRLIKITLKHKKQDVLEKGGNFFADIIKGQLGKRVIGPAIPGIPRIRNYYLVDILIKMERRADLLEKAKYLLQDTVVNLHKEKGFSGIRVNIDVDPY